MKIPPIPLNEEARIQKLLSYGILDTLPEQEFEDIVQLASEICQVPISLITLLDGQRQWFKAKRGLSFSETERNVAFCSYTILEEAPLVVNNALEDERFKENPLVTGESEIRFYVGVPLTTPEGFALGSLCVLDTKPRELSEKQIFALQTLAKQVVTNLELRLKVQEVEAQKKALEEVNDFQKKLFSIISHDLRSPLVNIEQLFEISQEEISVKMFQQLFESLQQKLGATRYMLDNLLKWASHQIYGHQIQAEKTDLATLVQMQVDVLQEVSLNKGNEVNMAIPQDFFVNTDKEVIVFILRNLLANANKFTQKGIIGIKAGFELHYWWLSVSDNGLGMNEKQLKQLRGKEQKYSRVGTAGERGTGIGLSLCQDFIKKLQGRLLIESHEGFGSTFRIEIPYV